MRSKIPTIIAIFILLLGVGAGIFLISRTQIFRLGASPETAPKDVRITNISANAFTVSWVTDQPTIGSVLWGESQNPNNTALGSQSEKNVHFVEVSGLAPNTTYFFKIASGGTDYDNSGIPWQTQTGPLLSASESTRVISGNVLGASGQAASEVIVYINASGMSPLSAKTTSSGGWLIPLGNARNLNLTGYMSIEDKNPLLEIFVQAGPQGIANAQIYPSSANPVPNIILGQTHDFRAEPENNVDTVPEADINLPQGEASPSSGFDVGEQTATAAATTVTLESITPGEIVTTTEPEFFGEGPPGTKITITVKSQTPQTQTVTINTAGDWQWTPPTDLTPGEHTVTLTWKDANNVLRTLTRTFTVQAAEGPAFESTPAATPASSPTASPTATPRVSLPATDSAIPESGVLTPTLALFIMGVGLIGVSFIIWTTLPKTIR
jgi:hypothetical protein